MQRANSLNAADFTSSPYAAEVLSRLNTGNWTRFDVADVLHGFSALTTAHHYRRQNRNLAATAPQWRELRECLHVLGDVCASKWLERGKDVFIEKLEFYRRKARVERANATDELFYQALLRLDSTRTREVAQESRNQELMRWRYELVDSEGQRCGHFEAAICNDEQQLDDCIRFSALPGGFERYRNHICLDSIWPMAVLLNIEVDQEKQHQGIGQSGLKEFYRQAGRKGAVSALGKVGWPPTEDWELHRDRNMKIYRNAGWVFLPQQGVEPYFIYRDLTTET